MPHTYACPLRWADMDLLGHVNNVTYLDYLAEARRHLFAGLPLGAAEVVRHRVEFARPLVFRRTPVMVDTWVTAVDEETVSLAHEVYDERDGERTRYLRATTVLRHRCDDRERAVLGRYPGADFGWPEEPHQPADPRDSYPVTVRLSDGGPGGTVRDVLLFEYFQEARIQYLMNMHTRGERWSHHVVARTDVDYLAPVHVRDASYAVHSWVGRLGRRSFRIEAELCDGDRVLATASVVMVTFDMDTQRSTDMSEEQRARLEQELAGS